MYNGFFLILLTNGLGQNKAKCKSRFCSFLECSNGFRTCLIDTFESTVRFRSDVNEKENDVNTQYFVFSKVEW